MWLFFGIIDGARHLVSRPFFSVVVFFLFSFHLSFLSFLSTFLSFAGPFLGLLEKWNLLTYLWRTFPWRLVESETIRLGHGCRLLLSLSLDLLSVLGTGFIWVIIIVFDLLLSLLTIWLLSSLPLLLFLFATNIIIIMLQVVSLL